MSSFKSEIVSKPAAACTVYWASSNWGKIARSEGGGRLEGTCEAMIAAREAMIKTQFSVKLSLHNNLLGHCQPLLTLTETSGCA